MKALVCVKNQPFRWLYFCQGCFKHGRYLLKIRSFADSITDNLTVVHI